MYSWRGTHGIYSSTHTHRGSGGLVVIEVVLPHVGEFAVVAHEGSR